ncbi:hypothetical protein IMY05_002G0180200 [Salix suchowensis]|nr:hypothetical protein IMY05_002G0180200 [Salix suchowensis]
MSSIYLYLCLNKIAEYLLKTFQNPNQRKLHQTAFSYPFSLSPPPLSLKNRTRLFKALCLLKSGHELASPCDTVPSFPQFPDLICKSK